MMEVFVGITAVIVLIGIYVGRGTERSGQKLEANRHSDSDAKTRSISPELEEATDN
jgi:hypothetical protein